MWSKAIGWQTAWRTIEKQARRAGFLPVRTWTDKRGLFSLQYFRQG